MLSESRTRRGPTHGVVRPINPRVPTWRLVPARANGQLAFGKYIWNREKRTFMPHGVNVLTLHGSRIAEITAFLTPDAFGRFGLADEIKP